MREMKDSGVPSIGLIPNGWRRILLEHCATIIRGGSPRPIEEYMSDNGSGYNWIKIGDTIKGNKYISEVREKIIPAGLSKTRLVKSGDLLLTNSMSYGEPYILKVDGCIHDGWLAFINIAHITKEFLYYLLASVACKTQFELASDGGVVQNLNIEKVKHTIIYYPEEGEQRNITKFLDTKCAEIDALAADIQTQIDTLEQYKRSVITEAVTKGLNPDAEMRDSGIDYIEYIPAHWALHPLSYYFGERKKKNILGLETNLLSLSYGKIVRKDIEANEGLLPENFNTYNIIEVGDIIIRPTDLQNDKRSLRTGLASERGIITSAYIALQPIRAVNSTYFHYLLHAFDVMKVFYNMGNGVRQGLNYSEFSRLMVVEPPVEEQNAIVEALDKKCAEIDTLMGEKRQQLATLADYKKSLIFEYVTGKKEVPAS